MIQPSASDMALMQGTPLVDPFGRAITYLRVSVTDRCDLRCIYCMSEHMTFLPRRDLLTLEELDRLCSAFVARGTRKLRITGGEPLVRRDIMALFRSLSRHLQSGALDELTLTTNGSQLAQHAEALAAAGVKRVNVSLDTLDPDKFSKITRRGDFGKVMEGIEAAQAAGLKVKINAVALKGINDDEFDDMVRWSHGRGMDITFIEVMPLGEDFGRRARHRSCRWRTCATARPDVSTSTPLPDRTGGPARYDAVAETGGRIGFITPLTHNFCEGCNRVRVTCTGTLYMCLGQNDAADLRAPLRASSARRRPACGHRCGDRPQAEGPRFRRRPPGGQGAGRPPDERHRRLNRGLPRRSQKSAAPRGRMRITDGRRLARRPQASIGAGAPCTRPGSRATHSGLGFATRAGREPACRPDALTFQLSSRASSRS